VFDVADGVLDDALFVGFADIAGLDGEAIVGGKVCVAGVEEGSEPVGMGEHGGLAVIDHDGGRDTAEELEGMAMAGEEVLSALTEGKLDVEHAAVGQDHDEEAEAASGGADGDGMPRAPVDLCAFAGCEGEGEKGFPGAGPDLLEVVLEGGDAAGEALVAEDGRDLHGGVRVFLEQAHDSALEGVEDAGAGESLSWAVGFREPFTHGTRGQAHLSGDLCGVQMITFGQLFQVAPLLVGDHRTPPLSAVPAQAGSRWWSTAPIGSGRPVRGWSSPAGACAESGARSRTW